MNDCDCYTCTKDRVDAQPLGRGPFDPRMSRMFLCAICGNKRCPHATDHRLSCTGSNEPGQAGSNYENAPKRGAPEAPTPNPTIAAQIEALAAKATARPWTVTDGPLYKGESITGPKGEGIAEMGHDGERRHGLEKEDAALICLLRNNLPAIVTALRQAEGASEGVVIDLEKEAWRSLCEAAEQSKWMPPEYMANDWLADCRDLLINGPRQAEAAPGVVEAAARAIADHPVNWIDYADKARAAIAALSAAAATPSDEVVRLRAALEFYADDRRWTPNSNMVTSAMDDRGHRARAALEPQAKDV